MYRTDSFESQGEESKVSMRRLGMTHVSMMLAVCMTSSCYHAADDNGYELDRSINADPDSLDPQEYSGSDAATVLYDIGEGLLTVDEYGQVTGGLAEKWHVLDDGKTLFFELRSGLKWSNGEDIDADEIVRSFQMLVDPASASPSSHNASAIRNALKIIGGELSPVELGLSTVDSNTIRIELEQATPYFFELLTHPSMQIRHANISEEARPGSALVTNGAYKVDEVVLGSSIALVKNKNYWNADNVKIERVLYHIVSQEVEPVRFEAGEIDVTDNVAESYFDKYQRNSPHLLRVAPTLGVYYYGINLAREPFRSNPALRRALSLSIDRVALVEKVLGRGELPAYAMVPPGVEGYRDDASTHILSQQEREAEAVRLFSKVNLRRDEQKIELRFNTGGGHERIAIAIAAMWHEVLGLDVVLRGEEFKVFLENVSNRSGTELYRLSWTGDYDDAYSFLQVFRSNNNANLVGFKNTRYDELLDEANAQTDANTRRQLLEKAEDVLLDEVAVIPIYFYVSKHLVSDNVVGWHDNMLDVHPSQYLGLLQ